MVRGNLAAGWILALLSAFIPPPPGAIVQNALVYLSGQAMHSQWRAVVSRKALGTSGDYTFYQWYLSLYRIDPASGNYKLAYQAPSAHAKLLDVVEKVDSSMWFPYQSLEIVGPAELMHRGVQELVVAFHQTGADCGSANITVLRYDGKREAVVPAVSIQNGCDLSAKIVPGAGGALDTLTLSGPYYGPNAPMCCATKPKASATLRYRNGRWTEAPAYYTLYADKYSP